MSEMSKQIRLCARCGEPFAPRPVSSRIALFQLKRGRTPGQKICDICLLIVILHGYDKEDN